MITLRFDKYLCLADKPSEGRSVYYPVTIPTEWRSLWIIFFGKQPLGINIMFYCTLDQNDTIPNFG